MKKQICTIRWILQILALLLLAAVGSAAVGANIYYITARPTPSGTGANPALNPNTSQPLYTEETAGNDTGAKSTASDALPRDGGRYFSNSFSNSTPDLGILLSPALGALLMSLSTIIVAVNAQLLRRAPAAAPPAAAARA